MRSNPAFFNTLTKLLIEKSLITQAEFMEKLTAEKAVYQAMMDKMEVGT